jgi:tetratricopeptide (TPR) repeat protein
MPGSSPLLTAAGNLYRDRVLETEGNLKASEAAYYWADDLLNASQKQIDFLYSSEGWRLSNERREKIYDVLNAYANAASQLQAAQRDSTKLRAQFDAAYGAYQKALDLLPANGLALVGLGQIEGALGDPEEALRNYQQAVAADPLSSTALVFLGNAYLALDQPFEAVPLFQRAIFHDPQVTSAQVGLVKTYQAIKTLDPSQAAVVVEYSQFSWGRMMEHQRSPF